MRKLRKAIPLALAMSVALTMTPIRVSAEEPTQVQAEQSDLVEENESLSDEADKDNEGYKLVFEDDFNGDQLDRKVWNVEKHEKGWVNGELQEYVDSDENIKVQDGYLNIIPVEKVETTSTTDGQNLLSNADFSSGMDDWTETIANWGSNGFDASAQSSVADGAITYTITNPGNDLWHVQLKQTVKLAAKKHYTLSYKVKSDVARTIETGVQGDEENNYISYGAKTQSLQAEKEESVSIDVYAEEGYDTATLYFSLGRKTGDTSIPDASVVTISDISLVETTANMLPANAFGDNATAGTKVKKSYTSGRISTQNLKTFTYGRFEVRAKVPNGQGYLPAFWLMANDENVYGQWPRCGEIDCMEVMGQDTNKLYGTIHYGNPHAESQGTYTIKDGEKSFSDDFHTFTCDWEPGKITWYVDGIKYHEESNWHSTTEGQGTLTYPAPFDQPFYIILNLAVGGSWVGNPNETTNFKNNPFVVDYVRVYQKDSYDENVTRPEVKFEPTNEPDESGNYIKNSTFAEAEDLTDGTNWKFITALDGAATAEIKDNSMVIKTENAGTVDYSVQLVQANVPFEKGATYEVSFDAKASENRKMNVDVKAPNRGYQSYMKTLVPELTTEMKHFSTQFVMKADSDVNGRLEFNMGNAGSGDIVLQNVVVKKTADPDPNAKEEKTILANGSCIYNGSFQEGINHLGYWDITPEGADIKVTGLSDGRRLVTEGKSVTISQSDLAFKEGTAYALSFDAYAQNGATVVATVGGNTYKVNVEAGNEKKDYVVKIPATAKFTDKTVSLKIEGAISLDNVKMVEDAKIKNGSFNDSLSGYEVYVDSAAKATVVVDSLKENNALDVTVDDTGADDWRIQIKQNNVLLEKGKKYKLSYEAKSTIDRKIRVVMQGGAALGWPVYSEHSDDQDANDGIVTLTSEYQKFTEEFIMTEETDAQAFLSICLGNVGGQITDQHRIVIDNISLVEAENPTPENPTPENPTPENPTPENPTPQNPIVKPVTVSYSTHIQSYGWNKSAAKNGAVAGTTGKAKRLEAIKISVEGNEDLGIQYTTHCQGYGWLNWSSNGEISGTTGEAKRLEAIKIQLTGADRDKYDVYYRVHAQGYGWMNWAKNGEAAGTAGLAKRLEAIQVVVVKKGESVPDKFEGVTASEKKAYMASAAATAATVEGSDRAHVQYRSHLQTYGWQNWKNDGDISGTTGKAKRLESLKLELKNKDYTGGICYNAHVQTIGWQADPNKSATWKKDGEFCGTTGNAKRLEAIQIELYGEMAEHYDIYYRVHSQTYGWMKWAKNGEMAGTTGQHKRIEGIQVVLVKKGEQAPSDNYKGAVTNTTKTFLSK
ncbi:carbohydrate binding domain-containing protein [Coprococcus sp. CLA-AA-H212]|uniref:Carbohydrate binding domain-containing protein n=1 Tax=Coprococcus hominis (ex Arizal et al. 2022) TaxID=2881262 RepID=A0ABS8FP96_9FIRM|nr:carbohydrate binding domain-containing protein [Coprococcus hominis (ex Arizal et al. 2022)]MCC2218428.1 carbohydrate binding domain-containing protein [Coprococcus hominis (ex Arizal et al. 2022)]